MSHTTDIDMNEIRIEANAPGLKLHGCLCQSLCPEAGNSKINGKAIEVKAAFRHMPAETSQVFIIFRRPVTGNNIDFLAPGTAVFYPAKEVDHLDADRFYCILVMAPEKIIDTAYLGLIIATVYPVTSVESLSGMDIIKSQDPFCVMFKARGTKDTPEVSHLIATHRGNRVFEKMPS